jgi:hypothetical protein
LRSHLAGKAAVAHPIELYWRALTESRIDAGAP